MKKIVVALLLASACWACGGGDKAPAEKKPVSNAEPETPAAAPAAPEVAKDGKALIEAADCRTCHKDNDKLIGPAYAEVAKKYTTADVKTLADKVISGGQGVWGQIPMAAHPQISEPDAEAMVKYILSMKK